MSDTIRKNFTASDQGVINEILFALNYLEKNRFVSYDREKNWLNSLKARLQ